MIGEVELCLFLARRITLIIAIIGFDGYQTVIASLHALSRKIEGDRQIASQMLLHKTTVDIDPLLTHDGLEMNLNLFTLHISRHHKMLAIPANALIIPTAAGLGRFQTVDMRGRDHFPFRVVESHSLGTSDISKRETPAFVEIINDTATILQREQTCHRHRTL